MKFEMQIIKKNYKKVFYVFGIIAILIAYFILNIYKYIKSFNYNFDFTYVKISILLLIVFLFLELWTFHIILSIILKIKKKEPYYIINQQGFYFKGIYKETILEWDTIEKFEVIKFRGVDMLRLYLNNEKKLYKQYSTIMKIFYKLNKYLLHGNGFIFDLASFEGKESEVITNLKHYINNKDFLNV